MINRAILSIILVILLSTWASAESLVWKAQKGNSVIYLGGTFHILRESDFPLPPEYDKAYQASQMIVFETDIGKFQEPAVQQKMLSKALYQDGGTLDKHLSPKAYQELSKYCETNGIPLQAFSRFRPSMVIAALTVNELMKLGVTQRGVDQFFFDQAKKDKKIVKGLETVDQQIHYVITMADGDEDGFISYSIHDLENAQEEFETLADAWRKGDAAKLDQLMNAKIKTRQPKLYKKLITDRNSNWMPFIERKTSQTRFILVGAAHLVGSEGLIERLKRKGYKVEKL